MHTHIRGTVLAGAACLLVLISTTGRAYADAPLTATTPDIALTAEPRQSSFSGIERRVSVRLGSDFVLSGRLRGVDPGSKVTAYVIRGKSRSVIDQATVGSLGRFRLSWRPRRPGNRRVELSFAGDAQTAPARQRLTVQVLRFRKANASYYSLFGNRTACGQTLTPKTIGVAHKTLPCGTKVTFAYHGETVTAPVLDRGPYVAGRDFDLTSGLKNKLHFGSTGQLQWAVQKG